MGKHPRGDHPEWSEKDLQKRLGELHLLKLDTQADLEEVLRTADENPNQARRITPLRQSLAAIAEETDKINKILAERDLMIE